MLGIRHFEKNVIRQVLDKLIPIDAPYCQKIQQLVMNIISFMLNYHIVIKGWSNID